MLATSEADPAELALTNVPVFAAVGGRSVTRHAGAEQASDAGARIGVMGGTFDPIHYGHLAAASQVAHDLTLDLVVFVPAGLPWQKRDREISGRDHRFLMTVLATTADPRFQVSRVDLDRAGPTYMVDTLSDLRAQFGPLAKFYLIAGVDTLAQLTTWRHPEKITAASTLIAVTRPGHTAADLDRAGVEHEMVVVPGIAVSSSGCRERIGRGEPVSYLLPPLVEQYIANNGLYRTTR